MTSKYYKIDYFQKSRNFLFPLVSNYTGNVESYLMCDEIDENILEYNLIVRIEKDVDIKDSFFVNNIISMYEKGKYNIYILDLSEWKDDIDMFLSGSYSKFSNRGKKQVLKYHNMLDRNGKYLLKSEIRGYHYFYVFFFPNKYKKEVAKDLYEIHKLFDNIEEAEEAVENMNEFCPIYDIEKETLKM